MAAKTFMYFGYGSNLLASRIHIQNPSAVFKGIGELKNHRLDFIGSCTNKWGGASATIVPNSNKSVWGAIWEIDMKNLPDLDDQEGIQDNIYRPKTVEIHKNEGGTVQCRTYEKVNNPPVEMSSYPAELPSKIYLHVIIQGALDIRLPQFYVETLKNIPHNNHYDEELQRSLGLPEWNI